MIGRGRARSWRMLRAAATALLLAGWALPLVVLAADPPPDPDSACSTEKSFKSTLGVAQATLTIINNTDQTVQSFWLNYNGDRVFYRQLAAHQRYNQPTWLTHPWIVASLDGTCYRLVVMTSLEQTVTLNPGAGGVFASPQPGSGSGPGQPVNWLPLVLGAGALAAVGAAVAAYWASHTGPAWWGTSAPAVAHELGHAGAVEAAAAVDPVEPYTGLPYSELDYTGGFFDQYGRPLAVEQVKAFDEAYDAWQAGGESGPRPASPVGNPDMPVDEQVAQEQEERRSRLIQESDPMYLEFEGHYYDPSGRPLTKEQVDTFEAELGIWQGEGADGPMPSPPVADPSGPVNEQVARQTAARHKTAWFDQDPHYIHVGRGTVDLPDP